MISPPRTPSRRTRPRTPSRTRGRRRTSSSSSPVIPRRLFSRSRSGSRSGNKRKRSPAKTMKNKRRKIQ